MRFSLSKDIKDCNGIKVINPLSINWDKFKWDGGYKRIELDQRYARDINKLIDERYANYEYTDIILNINGIKNPFKLKAGDVIYLPSINDIKNFIKKIRQ